MGRVKFCKDCAHYLRLYGISGYCQLHKIYVSPYDTCSKWTPRGHPSMIGWVIKSKYR